MYSRRVSSAAGFLTFVVIFAMGVLGKLWRAVGLAAETGAGDAFVWFPLGLGSELLVASVFGLIVAAVPNTRRRAAYITSTIVCVAVGIWLGLNDVSYRISQIGITYWRLRGDEGLRLRDFGLVAPGDVIPAVGLGVVFLAIFVAAMRKREFLGTKVPPPIVVVVVVVIGVAVSAVDVVYFSKRNFGMAESPVSLLLRTYAQAIVHGKGYVRLKHGIPVPKNRDGLKALLVPREPQPPPTVPARATTAAKNGILFFSEGVPRKHTGLNGAETTPRLMETIAAHGALEFEHWYSPYHKSIAAIYAMTCADVPPPNAKNITELNPRIDCGATPEIMAKNGIHAGLFHGGDFGFYDKLQLLGMRGFEVQKDARALAVSGAWDNEWGVDDRVVVDAALAWIDTIPKDERFFLVYIPITAHYPFAIPPDVTPAFPGSSSKARYLSAVHFLDSVYGRLVDGLKARGRFDETAILYTADHGETVAERPRAQAGRRMAYEPSLNVPMAIVSPSQFSKHEKSQRVVSHVDLLPTAMDLMGLAPDSRHLGRSAAAADFEARRVFIGASNGPKFIGFVDGRQKFVAGRSTGTFELYDLIDDPDETNNLAERDPAKIEQLTDEALAFADGQLRYLQNALPIDDAIDVQERVLEFAEVRVVDKNGKTTVCSRPADSLGDDAKNDDDDLLALPYRRVCPGFEEPVMYGSQVRMIRRTHDCVLVNVPTGGGAVELVVRDQEWQPFVTRIRAAIDDRATGKDDEATITGFGDGIQGQTGDIGEDARTVRVSFPSSQKELVMRVSAEERLKTPICLTLTEAAWRKPRPKKPKPAAKGGEDDVAADVAIEDAVAADKDDKDGVGTDDDDHHGRTPRAQRPR